MRINEEKIIDGKRFICVEFDKDGSPVLQRTKLYICDHAKRSCSCHGELYKPHSHNRIYDGMCPGYKVMVKGIPYKEEPKEEPEGSEYIHIADGLEDEKPEPESVEDVLKRIPNPKNYQDPISGVINLRGYYNAMKSCFKDLKAAQEREGNK